MIGVHVHVHEGGGCRRIGVEREGRGAEGGGGRREGAGGHSYSELANVLGRGSEVGQLDRVVVEPPKWNGWKK